jgi:GAF domain-containing protein
VVYPLIIVLAGLLLGGRATAIFTVLSVLAAVSVYYVEATGLADYPGEPTLAGEVVIVFVTFVLVGLLLRYAVRNLTAAVERARRNAGAQVEANRALEMTRASLEERVAERTTELERRARSLGVSAQVARDAAAAIGDPQALLAQVVELIGVRLGFYHVGIFLLDVTGERATLAAASSEGGQRMLARGYEVQIQQDASGSDPSTAIIGDVVRQGTPRTLLDVNLDVEFSYDPELLDTRSQVVLPLQARGEIIGVLDVRSTEPQAFGDEDVTVLQTLADQVAMAISNARLFREAQEALRAERQAYGEVTQEAWREMLRQQAGSLGVIRNDRGLALAGDLWRPRMQEVLQTGRVAIEETSLGIPIVVRDRVIGVIDATKPDGAAWTADEVEMVTVLAEQLNVALDGARLYQETQHQAAREQMIGDMAAQFTRALDLDALLQTAVRELGQLPNVAEVAVHIDVPEGDVDVPEES